MIEHAITFGREESLVGIFSEPETSSFALDKPAILLLNANVLHRIGPYRLHVKMARRFIQLGYPVLRFDLSGIGDSFARKSDLAYDERIVSEVKGAMSFLASKKGVNKFILMGLCAGADSAYRTAVADKRVVGMVLLDGYGYRTVQYYLRNFQHYLPRLISPGAWLRVILRRFKKLAVAKEKQDQEDMSIFYTGVRNFPSQKQMETDLKRFIKNNVKILCVFTGSLKYSYYNYENQFQDMFKSIKFNDDIEIVYNKEAAHTYIDIDDRNRLIDTISKWLTKHFG